MNVPDIRVVFFDFGGVLAEEGFYQGLRAVAAEQGLNPDAFFHTAVERIFATGYIVGGASEAAWWEDLRGVTGLTGSDLALRREILPRFVLRPKMLSLVETLRKSGIRTAILSDQTNWLDELDADLGFSTAFDKVFNSYHVGLHKREAACFRNALREMDVPAHNALFIDDARRNIDLARQEGLHAIHYDGREAFTQEFSTLFPALGAAFS